MATLVQVAACAGDGEFIELLLHREALLSACGAALRSAAAAGQTRVVSLLAQGMSVLPESDRPLDEADSDHLTAMHYASRHGHTNVVRVLHAHGCSLTRPGAHSLTPPAEAAVAGHTETLLAMRDLGCDLRAPGAVTTRTADNAVATNSLVHLAGSGSQSETIRALVASGCDVNFGKAICSEDGSSHMWTTAHAAALAGRCDVLQTLLELRADINLKCEGKTAVDSAVNDAVRDVFRQHEAATRHT